MGILPDIDENGNIKEESTEKLYQPPPDFEYVQKRPSINRINFNKMTNREKAGFIDNTTKKRPQHND